MKSINTLKAELAFKLTKRAFDVQNSGMWIERISQCVELEDLCKLSAEFSSKHRKCTYPRSYEQAAEEALHALLGHVLTMRIPEQDRLKMMSILRQQRSNLAWLQRACFHYGL